MAGEAVPAAQSQPTMENAMNAIAAMPGPAVREIPLSLLSLAPENVRRTPPDAASDAEIKASIKALGLLENLVVRADLEDADGTGPHAVIAGGRRLKALQELAGEGVIDPDHPVPCQVRSGDVDSGEVSLAENVVRVAMHPADQVEAFGRLAAAGQPVSAIAARFGASERLVEQRLRLGSAAPELLDAYRADRIDLEVLKAFAVTTDRERQLAIWEQVSAQGHRPSAWQVQRLLTEERVPGSSMVARFVGTKAYEAVGGQVMRDLFATSDETGTWFEDPVLLDRLAMDKLREAADELATRWKWVTPMVRVAWEDTASFGRIHPQPADPTEEERAEIKKLEARLQEIEGLDDDDWTNEIEIEAGAIETRLDEIDRAVDARAAYRPEDFAIAGCIVTIAHDDGIEVIQGLVKPEDMPERTEDGDGANDGHDDAHVQDPPIAPSVSLDRDREAAARKEAGVGVGLADDLRAIRTALVKAHLATDFEAAFDLFLFQAARAVFLFRHAAHALDISVRETADRPTTRMNDASFADWSPGEAMLQDRSGLALDWMEIEDDGEAFAALRALPRVDKEALFAACVARTVKPQLAFEALARPELEATVARLGINFAARVRPTAEMLWSRISKGRIMEIARATLGVSWAADRSRMKKAELAAAMETAFAAGDRPVSLSAEMHAAALAWTAPGFEAFDTGRVTYPIEDRTDGNADSVDATAEAANGAETDLRSDGDEVDFAETVRTVVENGVAEIRSGSAQAKAPATGNGVAKDVDDAPGTPAANGADADDRANGADPAIDDRAQPTPSGNGHDAASGPEAGANGASDPEDATDAPGCDADAHGDGDPEAGTDATAVPGDLGAMIDAVNSVPTADGGPRVILSTTGSAQEAGQAPTNGYDPSVEPAEIPEFLRDVR